MQLDFSIDKNLFQHLQSRPVFVRDRPALFQISGPGALDCVQGLVTCDVVAAGENSLSYGAILTNKGMIILDPFVLRVEGSLLLVLPGHARELARNHFGRTLPPRLAKLTDRSEEWGVLWIFGDASGATVETVFGASPKPGKLTLLDPAGPTCLARASGNMPFAYLLVGPIPGLNGVAADLASAGAIQGDETVQVAARVLSGWPSLGREIDEKTLPQEVRYDELGAVSYSKGCYTGQETVARVHFRGHPNRYLGGVVLPPGPVRGERQLFRDGKEVGVLRTTIQLPDRTIGLATVRREIPGGATLLTGNGEARVVPLPLREAVPA